MSEGTVGLVIFFIIAIGSALAWHWCVTIYSRAVIGATFTTVIVFQIAAYLHIGYLDSFFLIAVITTSVMAAVMAFIIGLPFRSRRKRLGSNDNTL
jgi:hypothetical protein